MYQPGIVPSDPKQLSQFLTNELLSLQRALSDKVAHLNLQVTTVAPDKPRDGIIVLADGVSWNPGSGPGYYGYRAGAWRFLG